MDPVSPRRTGVGGLVVALVDRVFVEPVRQGAPRVRDWAPGMRAIGLLVAMIIVAALAAVSLAETELLPLRGSASGLAVPLGPQLVLFALTVVLALAQTTALHAPLPLALALWGFVGAALTVIAALPGHVWPDPVSAAGPVTWLVLGGLAVLRRRAAPRWWEFAAVWALVLVTTYLPLALAAARIADGQARPSAGSVQILALAAASAAVPAALLAGASLAAVACSLCLWVVELGTARARAAGRPGRVPRGLVVATAAVAVAAVGGAGWQLVAGSLGWLDAATGLASAAAVLLAIAIGWALLDALADERSPASTGVGQLIDHLPTVAWPAAVALGAVSAVLILPVVMLATWQVTWAAVPFSDTVAGVLTVVSANPTLVGSIGAVAAAVICIGLGLRLAVRGVRGPAELLFAVGVVQALLQFGEVSSFRIEPAAVGLLAGLVVAAMLIITATRGRLTGPVAEAYLTALLITVAIANLELLADPVGTVLQSVGGVVAVLALFWTVLTSGDLANGDSPRFPRSSRVMLVLANLLVAVLLVAATTLTTSTGNTTSFDGIVSSGARDLGVPLLLVVLASVLAAALRGAEPGEPAAPVDSPGHPPHFRRSPHAQRPVHRAFRGTPQP